MLTKMMTFPTDATAVSGGPMIFSFTQKFELKLRSFLPSNHAKPTKIGMVWIKTRFWVREVMTKVIKGSQLVRGIEVLWISKSIHESYHWITSTPFLNDEMSNLSFGSSFFEWLAGFVHAAICQCLWSRRDSAGFISLADSVIVGIFFLGIFWLGCKVVDPYIVGSL